MGCLVVALALLLPRLTLVLIWLFSDWLGTAYETWIWPLLGFLFMPYTTLAYMGARLHGGLQGWWLALFVLAILVDLGHWGGSGSYRRRHR